MVKKIIDKRNYIIFFIIIILFMTILFLNITKVGVKTKKYYYFGEDIATQLYTNKNVSKVFKNIGQIYKKYDNYYKKKNTNDKDFIELVKYGKDLYDKSFGYIDITSYKLLESILDEKEYSFKTKINSLDFSDEKSLTDINIQSIIGAYATKEVLDYLENEKMDYYVIREDDNIITGSCYDKKYNIPIIKDDNIIDIVAVQNKSISIKGSNDNFKAYMVNPITSKKNAENKLVAVIGDDINETNFIANVLYLMDVNEGKEFADKYKVEVLWYNNDKIEKTSGFNKYEIRK